MPSSRRRSGGYSPPNRVSHKPNAPYRCYIPQVGWPKPSLLVSHPVVPQQEFLAKTHAGRRSGPTTRDRIWPFSVTTHTPLTYTKHANKSPLTTVSTT